MQQDSGYNQQWPLFTQLTSERQIDIVKFRNNIWFIIKLNQNTELKFKKYTKEHVSQVYAIWVKIRDRSGLSLFQRKHARLADFSDTLWSTAKIWYWKTRGFVVILIRLRTEYEPLLRHSVLNDGLVIIQTGFNFRIIWLSTESCCIKQVFSLRFYFLIIDVRLNLVNDDLCSNI